MPEIFGRLGFTCGFAGRAATLVAATLPRTGTQPSISMRPAIRSSRVTFRRKVGDGATWTRSCSICPIGRRLGAERSHVIT